MTHTPTRILVPTDFSPASDRALSFAKEIAARFNAEIHVLHVRVVLDDPSMGSEVLDEVERILTISEPSTRRALEQACDDGRTAIHAHMMRGTVPAEVIVDAVSEYECDLVILGTHGRRGLERFLSGSVAQEVVHDSPVPVLTIRASGGSTFPPREILVAVDYSEESLKAVEWAAAVARLLEAGITLLHVVQPLHLPKFYALALLPEQHDERIVSRCQEALDDVAMTYLEEVPFTTAVIRAHVAEGVSRFAKENNMDLVVLATKGLSGLGHILLGSVAERVVRLSEVPVLTVRESS